MHPPRLRYRFLAVGVFFLIFPFFLRRRPRVERRITICSPPEAIYPFFEDLKNWPLWVAEGWRENAQITVGEVSRGLGATQEWRTAKFSGQMRVLRSDRDERMDYELECSGGRIRGRIDLMRDGACTRVCWRSVWEPAENPYLRYLDLFCRWQMGRNFSEGLSNLKALVEEAETE